MRGGRFLSCRHGAIGVVHLVVVHGPGHGVDFSGIVCFVERFTRKEKKKFQRFFFIILGEKVACTFFFFTKEAPIFSNNDGAKPWRTSPDSGLRSFPRVDSAWFLKQWHQRDAAAPAQRLPSLKLFRPI